MYLFFFFHPHHPTFSSISSTLLMLEIIFSGLALPIKILCK
nr:MAG TPA: hypothetical protein [Caudoviricetes sp.]